jgi:hypothetical protein
METRKTWTQHRNSITGKYCSAEYAKAHPDTTQSIARETAPRPNEPETTQEQD